MLQLPPPRFRLPREKKIPEAKAQTKWEKFAESKGIQKRKRSRMVFDEDKDECVVTLLWPTLDQSLASCIASHCHFIFLAIRVLYFTADFVS